ncbi:hypothetical protein [Nostoc sp.]
MAKPDRQILLSKKFVDRVFISLIIVETAIHRVFYLNRNDFYYLG